MSKTGTEGTLRQASENLKETIGSPTGDIATQSEAKTGELRGCDGSRAPALSSNGLAVLTGAAAMASCSE
ncbi:hypothetical protein SAMN05446935_9857 [Burkholderia sp. YR290]|jgi:hypothetical protein|uniref:CsbD family protein n=1 Tax=Paraburkholderia hospita TaxID=169430 RepID=A0ABN0FUT8_9BURK|nr:hypothetical protein [Paraburkholderia hospita]EIN02573.1 CsbD family protein [Paraburkholderia hospita]OUL68341.1 hypothetical protein CA602_51715 [Paraburkholderia hospita]SOE90551.1 hypothetical protein SAMN05446935_9857 [Burkholderia sp. YR290]